MDGQAACDDIYDIVVIGVVGRTAVNLFIVHVVEAEGYDLVLSGQELELVAAQAEFGALVVGGAEDHGLHDGCISGSEFDAQFPGGMQVIEFIDNGPGLRGGSSG